MGEKFCSPPVAWSVSRHASRFVNLLVTSATSVTPRSSNKCDGYSVEIFKCDKAQCDDYNIHQRSPVYLRHKSSKGLMCADMSISAQMGAIIVQVLHAKIPLGVAVAARLQFRSERGTPLVFAAFSFLL